MASCSGDPLRTHETLLPAYVAAVGAFEVSHALPNAYCPPRSEAQPRHDWGHKADLKMAAHQESGKGRLYDKETMTELTPDRDPGDVPIEH